MIEFSGSSGSDDSRSLRVLTDRDREKLEKDYKSLTPRNVALLDEVTFILKERIAVAEIKIHSIEERIKSLRSVLDKCERKGIQDFAALQDLVGARVVCLFRSDMARIGELLEANFDVVSVDDKILEGGPLGYLSVHYICKMPNRYQGPRYENTVNAVFEVQVRTLCMHAWAAVSHHLDYKGEWDVPEDLKRALSALSGLFYVADSEFEQFNAARLESKARAEREKGAGANLDINLDTVGAYLANRFPDRGQSNAEAISQLVHEIKAAGYISMAELDRDMIRGEPAFLEYERTDPPVNGRYLAAGVVRVTLRLVSEEMRQLEESGAFGEKRKEMGQRCKDFIHLVKPKLELSA